jgi:Xaa-Pro aminopeptidase
MEKHQIEWLNAYNALVYEKLSPGLSPEEQQWLRAETQPI